MPYSVVDDDTSLEVRASIEYARTDELTDLIVTLQNRLIKMETSRERPADTVQSLQPGDAGTAGNASNGSPEDAPNSPEGEQDGDQTSH